MSFTAVASASRNTRSNYEYATTPSPGNARVNLGCRRVEPSAELTVKERLIHKTSSAVTELAPIRAAMDNLRRPVASLAALRLLAQWRRSQKYRRRSNHSLSTLQFPAKQRCAVESIVVIPLPHKDYREFVRTHICEMTSPTQTG